MIDLSTAAAWLGYREDVQSEGENRKDILDYLDFHISVAEGPMYSEEYQKTTKGDRDESTEEARPNWKQKKCSSLPPTAKRKCGAQHLPKTVTTLQRRKRSRYAG